MYLIFPPQLFLSMVEIHWLNACNSAQDENACCGLSPLAGTPITRTATKDTGVASFRVNRWLPDTNRPLSPLVAVVAG